MSRCSESSKWCPRKPAERRLAAQRDDLRCSCECRHAGPGPSLCLVPLGLHHSGRFPPRLPCAHCLSSPHFLFISALAELCACWLSPDPALSGRTAVTKGHLLPSPPEGPLPGGTWLWSLPESSPHWWAAASYVLRAGSDSSLLLTHHIPAERSFKAREVTVLPCLWLSTALRVRPRLSSVSTAHARGSGPSPSFYPACRTPSTTEHTSHKLPPQAGGSLWVLLSWLLTVSLSTASRKTSLSQMTVRPPVAASSFTLICFLLITCQNAGEGVERRKPSYIAGGNETDAATMENRMKVP